MINKLVEVKASKGIYARSATLLVRKASQFKSEIVIEYKGKSANGKSLINVLSLAVPSNSLINISASGDDEQFALEEMIKLVNSLE